MKYRGLFLSLIVVFWLGFTPIADALMCRDRYEHQVCILQLKRSAKYYWEYRAKVSVDGVKQRNREIYNCRDRTLTRKGKYPIHFQPNSPGELVCQTFQDKINSYKLPRW